MTAPPQSVSDGWRCLEMYEYAVVLTVVLVEFSCVPTTDLLFALCFIGSIIWGPGDVGLMDCVYVKRINISIIECPEKYKLFVLFMFLL